MENTDVSAVKMMINGAPYTPPAVQQLVEIFDRNYNQLYGLTEATGAATYLLLGDHDGSDKMKSMGKVM